MRLMLCIHADSVHYMAALRRTVVRRTLLWVPLSLVPFLLYSLGSRLLRGQAGWLGVVGSEAGSLVSSALTWLALLITTVLILVLWAALSLQALASLQPAQAKRPSASRLPVAPAAQASSATRTAPVRLLATAALVLFAVAVAGMNRMALVHYYLRYTDARYHPAPRSNRSELEQLHRAMIDSACKGDLPFLKKLVGMDLRPGTETLGMALDCAVTRSDGATATYLLDTGASTFAAFRNAVAARNIPMVRLLVARGAAAERYESYSNELGMAAKSRDLVLMKILIDGGAVQDGYSDAGRIAIYAYLLASAPADDSAASWEPVLADGLAAGLELKTRYKKADGVLHFAASRRYLGLVEVRLARGGDHKAPGKDGMLPFMQLAEWFPGPDAAPGPVFERVLLALTSGVDNINTPVTMKRRNSSGVIIRQETNWTIARSAALNHRVRALLGARVDDASIGQWPAMTREEAMALMEDPNDKQLVNAPPLAPHWRASRWEDLAQEAERRRH